MKKLANNRHASLKKVLPLLIAMAQPQSTKEANAVREAKRLVRYLTKN